MNNRVNKSDTQIEAVVKALEEIKPNVRRYSVFGDDNWAAIDAQLNVLKKKMTYQAINNEYWKEGDEGDHVYSSALDARSYLDGDYDNIIEDWRALCDPS